MAQLGSEHGRLQHRTRLPSGVDQLQRPRRLTGETPSLHWPFGVWGSVHLLTAAGLRLWFLAGSCSQQAVCPSSLHMAFSTRVIMLAWSLGPCAGGP